MNVKIGRIQALDHTNVPFFFREIFGQKEVVDSKL